MKIFLGCDHAAFELKEKVKDLLLDHVVVDLGTQSSDRVNYPEFAKLVAGKVRAEVGSRGILLCGSGIGMSMVANRFRGIRAALCCTEKQAKLSREHNNANILCLGARTTEDSIIQKIIPLWLETPFEGGRHQERLDLFAEWGQEF